MPLNKPHQWQKILVDGGPVGADEFYICFECGTSGGPVDWSSKGPGSYGRFLAGAPLSDLSEDCAEAKQQIDEFVARYPRYKELVGAERSPNASPLVVARSANDGITAKCPWCNEEMVWEEHVPPPNTGQPCDGCRDTLVAFVQHDPYYESEFGIEAERFMRLLYSHSDIVRMVVEQGKDFPGNEE